MLLADLVEVSQAVRSTRSRTGKVEALAGLLRRLEPEEAPVAISYLSGTPRQPRLGVGHATVYAVSVDPAAEPTLSLVDVDETLEELAGISGPGSKAAREALIADLLGRAIAPEQEFLIGLMLRELRQGALEGSMADAVAVALDIPPARVRRAAMLSGDLTGVASTALAEGADALARFALELHTAVQPMLAQTAADVTGALGMTGPAVVDWKLDGVRIQVVTVFTRNLNDVSHRVPEVVEAALALPVRTVVLDGEAIALDPTGRPRPFQVTMERFGRQHGLAEARQRVPLSVRSSSTSCTSTGRTCWTDRCASG
jgi:DNA ligase 1